MSLADRLREYVSTHRSGMIDDLLFAVAWVVFVSLLFDFVFTAAPRWVFYMFLLAGIPAHLGFFWSLEIAKRGR